MARKKFAKPKVKGPKRLIAIPKQRAGGVMKPKRRGHGWTQRKNKK
jgi:hypothetical protein